MFLLHLSNWLELLLEFGKRISSEIQQSFQELIGTLYQMLII